MHVDSDRHVEFGDNTPRHASDIVWDAAAIRIAQHQAVRSGLTGSAQGSHCIVRIGAIPIKEVLSVEKHFKAMALEIGNGLADHCQVVFQSRVKYSGDVMVPCLAHNADGAGAGADECLYTGIVLDTRRLVPRAAKRRNRDVLPLDVLRQAEEFLVLGIRTRVTALDVVDAEFIQAAGNLELVRGGEREPFGLRAVAQRRIVYHDLTTRSLLLRERLPLLERRLFRQCSSQETHLFTVVLCSASQCRSTGFYHNCQVCLSCAFALASALAYPLYWRTFPP